MTMAEKRGDKAAWPGAGGETDQADRKGSKMAVTKLDSGLGGGEIAAKGRDYQVCIGPCEGRRDREGGAEGEGGWE